MPGPVWLPSVVGDPAGMRALAGSRGAGSWRASSAIPCEVQLDMAVAREVLYRTDYPGC